MREDAYYAMSKGVALRKQTVMLCDRGARGGEAYVGRSDFFAICERCGIEPHALFDRYAAVIHLVSASVGAEKHYTLSNNTARKETLEEARELEARSERAWRGHPHRFIIDNSTGFERKMRRALNSLARVLSMPKPREKERKFKVNNFDRSMIPHDAVEIQVKQDYLPDTEMTERRVRSRFIDGGVSYYYTEKTPTGIVGERDEPEWLITLGEYEAFLRDRDPASKQVVKTRYCFAHAGKHFELDLYVQPVDDLVILEVELENMSDPIEFPPGWVLEEVTGDKRYSNREIARGSLAVR
jgi:CYTH domain-containing protein